MLRQANQRHISIFAQRIDDLTPMQFAACAKLAELGPSSQSDLGRQTAMDSATMKGVIDRLVRKGLVATRQDPADQRRLIVELTSAGKSLYRARASDALSITDATLAPLSPSERRTFVALLGKLTQQETEK